jgi:hypothetical protein
MREWTDPHIADHGERLWNEISFLGLHRPGYTSVIDELPPSFRWLDGESSGIKMVSQELSSSEIRARMNADAFGEYERTKIMSRNMSKIEGLMPAPVLAHILRNELYQS